MSLDIHAVCERHGVESAPDGYGGWYASYITVDQQRVEGNGDTCSDAVCAALKVRYGIETHVAPTITDGQMWQAMAMVDGLPVDRYSYESELDAVVQVADCLTLPPVAGEARNG
jgi:hypothetical protein